MRLIIVRHGETAANIDRRYLGHKDSLLTPLGVSQAQNVAQKLKDKGIKAIYSSDLPRATASAAFLAAELGLEMKFDYRLRELNFGRIELMTYDEAMQHFPQEVTNWYNDIENNTPPEGESLSELRKRVWSFLRDIFCKDLDVIAVYTHGGVCRALLAEATGQPFACTSASPGESFVFHLIRVGDSLSIKLDPTFLNSQ